MNNTITLIIDDEGNLIDAKGLFVASNAGFKSVKEKPQSNDKRLIKLKEAGFTVDDIIAMYQEGLI